MSLPKYEDCLHVNSTFWDKVDINTPWECWNWTRYKDKKGYGRVGVKGRTSMCTVVCYKLIYGDYPDKNELGEDWTVDHICENTSCCNPLHLRLVTRGQNTRLGKRNASSLNTAKTHCPEGHEYTEDNIRIVSGKWRRCLTCSRRQRMEQYWRKRSIKLQGDE